MVTVILSLLVAGSAALHIRAEYRGPRIQVYVFKPLTMAFILLMALWVGWAYPSLYTWAIVAGLCCSLAGDVFLMLPSDRFLPGLASFLAAHLLYVLAFTWGVGFRASWWSWAPLVLYGAVVLGLLWPHLVRMRWPVVVYVAVILTMAWRAWERWAWVGGNEALWAACGAVLFLVSDTALAFRRFRGPYAGAQALTLSTYVAAQWLIARSVA